MLFSYQTGRCQQQNITVENRLLDFDARSRNPLKTTHCGRFRCGAVHLSAQLTFGCRPTAKMRQTQSAMLLPAQCLLGVRSPLGENVAPRGGSQSISRQTQTQLRLLLLQLLPQRRCRTHGDTRVELSLRWQRVIMLAMETCSGLLGTCLCNT